MPKTEPYFPSRNTYPSINKSMFIALESLEYYDTDLSGVGSSTGGARDHAFSAVIYINGSSTLTPSNWKSTVKKINKQLRKDGQPELDSNITQEQYNTLVNEYVNFNEDKGQYQVNENRSGNLAYHIQQAAKTANVQTYPNSVITSKHLNAEALDFELNGDMHKFLKTEKGQQWASDNHIWADVHGGHVHLSFNSLQTRPGKLNNLTINGNTYEYTPTTKDDTQYDALESRIGDVDFSENAIKAFEENASTKSFNGSEITVFNANDENKITTKEYVERENNNTVVQEEEEEEEVVVDPLLTEIENTTEIEDNSETAIGPVQGPDVTPPVVQTPPVVDPLETEINDNSDIFAGPTDVREEVENLVMDEGVFTGTINYMER